MPANGDWDKVMQAYYKQTARRMKEDVEKQKTMQQIFGSLGDKMTCDEIQEIFRSGGFIIDVRNPVDYLSGGRIHNSVNVPSANVINWCNEHKKIGTNTPILVYSDTGNSADQAQQLLVDSKYTNVTNIGTHKWYNLCS
jgi:rhodanese-related sulfurtransferase|tara:strand:+ start:135 stop:551 length:417 start_codon:yes stop_codon:yes gene_type:complete